MKRPIQHERVIVCRTKKFHIGDNVVLAGYGVFRGEVFTVEEVRKRWLIVKNDYHRICVQKRKCLTIEEAKEKALAEAAKADGNNERDRFTVIEYCPHCENEATVEWDLQKDGYEMFCPYCGKRILICSECPMGDSCDWGENTGCSMRRYSKIDSRLEGMETDEA